VSRRLSASVMCVQVDANSDPHPIHRRFAFGEATSPFLGEDN